MRLCHVLVLFAVLLPCVEGNHGLRTDDTNADVLRIARSIPDGGGYNTAFTGSGTPVEIQFQGQKILSQAVGGDLLFRIHLYCRDGCGRVARRPEWQDRGGDQGVSKAVVRRHKRERRAAMRCRG